MVKKTNLEKYKQERKSSNVPSKSAETCKSSESTNDSLQAALQYRDRAKERRSKFGTPEPPSPPSPPSKSLHSKYQSAKYKQDSYTSSTSSTSYVESNIS